jgi:hypothetical protein
MSAPIRSPLTVTSMCVTALTGRASSAVLSRGGDEPRAGGLWGRAYGVTGHTPAALTSGTTVADPGARHRDHPPRGEGGRGAGGRPLAALGLSMGGPLLLCALLACDATRTATETVQTPSDEPGAEQVVEAAREICGMSLYGVIRWRDGVFVCGNEQSAMGCNWAVTDGIDITVSRAGTLPGVDTVFQSALAYELAHSCLHQNDSDEVLALSKEINAAAETKYDLLVAAAAQ